MSQVHISPNKRQELIDWCEDIDNVNDTNDYSVRQAKSLIITHGSINGKSLSASEVNDYLHKTVDHLSEAKEALNNSESAEDEEEIEWCPDCDERVDDCCCEDDDDY